MTGFNSVQLNISLITNEISRLFMMGLLNHSGNTRLVKLTINNPIKLTINTAGCIRDKRQEKIYTVIGGVKFGHSWPNYYKIVKGGNII